MEILIGALSAVVFAYTSFVLSEKFVTPRKIVTFLAVFLFICAIVSLIATAVIIMSNILAPYQSRLDRSKTDIQEKIGADITHAAVYEREKQYTMNYELDNRRYLVDMFLVDSKDGGFNVFSIKSEAILESDIFSILTQESIEE